MRHLLTLFLFASLPVLAVDFDVYYIDETPTEHTIELDPITVTGDLWNDLILIPTEADYLMSPAKADPNTQLGKRIEADAGELKPNSTPPPKMTAANGRAQMGADLMDPKLGDHFKEWWGAYLLAGGGIAYAESEDWWRHGTAHASENPTQENTSGDCTFNGPVYIEAGGVLGCQTDSSREHAHE